MQAQTSQDDMEARWNLHAYNWIFLEEKNPDLRESTTLFIYFFFTSK